VTGIQLAAMSRADVPEEDRGDFHLYVDEFYQFATESFATILSEARKFRLSLTVATQYPQHEKPVSRSSYGSWASGSRGVNAFSTDICMLRSLARSVARLNPKISAARFCCPCACSRAQDTSRRSKCSSACR
jgi:hypothetical protein